MRLAQTNLQLYDQLMAAGWKAGELATTRAAYDLARQLFLGCYRPTHKDFVAHLVGVASALAHWGQPRERVWAGLLHSAYLYGDFGDGGRGAAPYKRGRVSATVGEDAEALVDDYTRAEGMAIDELGESAIIALRLADLADECVDGGVAFAPGKGLPLGALYDGPARERITALARRHLSEQAAQELRGLLQEVVGADIPPQLRTTDLAFSRLLAPESSLLERTEGRVRRLVGLVRRRFG